MHVKTSHPSGELEIVFFRHGDGSWFAFPADNNRPTMSVGQPVITGDELRFEGEEGAQTNRV